jgi:predicted dehydrogenase
MQTQYTDKTIHAGVVGCGFIGRIHIEALRRLGYVNLAAVASRSQKIADKKARELSVPRAYGNWVDLVADDEVEVVHICTTNDLHYPIAKACIEAGKHVICEKPLALTVKEAGELWHAAEERGVVHAICHNLRYYPLVKQARAMVQAGEIGTVRLVHGHYLQDWLFLETDYNWRLVSELSGKSRAVADIGTHWLDMVQHITEQKVGSVCADTTIFIPVRKKPLHEVQTYSQERPKALEYEEVEVDTEDHATVMLKFSGGAKGVLIVSMDPSAARYAGAPCGLEEGYLDTFKYIFSDVYGWVREGVPMDVRSVPFPTFKTGYELLCIVEAIFRSSTSGAWEEVRM